MNIPELPIQVVAVTDANVHCDDVHNHDNVHDKIHDNNVQKFHFQRIFNEHSGAANPSGGSD